MSGVIPSHPWGEELDQGAAELLLQPLPARLCSLGARGAQVGGARRQRAGERASEEGGAGACDQGANGAGASWDGVGGVGWGCGCGWGTDLEVVVVMMMMMMVMMMMMMVMMMMMMMMMMRLYMFIAHVDMGGEPCRLWESGTHPNNQVGLWRWAGGEHLSMLQMSLSSVRLLRQVRVPVVRHGSHFF